MNEEELRRGKYGGRVRALWISVVVASAGYLAFTLWSGWEEVAAAFVRIGFGGILLALSLTLASFGLRFWRWKYYLRLLGYEPPLLWHFRIYVAGFALTTTPGKAGEMLRSVYLGQRGVPVAKSVAAFIAERLSDLLAVLLLSGLGLWTSPGTRPFILIAAGVTVAGLFILKYSATSATIARWSHDFLPARMHGIFERIQDVAQPLRRTLRPDALALGLSLGVPAWALQGLGFWVLLQWLGLNVDVVLAVFVYSFAMLVGALSFLPGGLGSAEAAMIALLLSQGIPEPSAAAVTIVIRACTLWFAVFLGLLALPRAAPPSSTSSDATSSDDSPRSRSKGEASYSVLTKYV